MKQVIVIRKDLGMRKGKMIAQGAHACLQAYNQAEHQNPEVVIEWFETGSTKIVVGVNSENELKDIYYLAKAAKLPSTIIRDAGRTEFKEPTLTAVAIGPWHDEVIDLITGRLTLL
jgi:PTH2 family peptidyl-tRNA hydrolase